MYAAIAVVYNVVSFFYGSELRSPELSKLPMRLRDVCRTLKSI